MHICIQRVVWIWARQERLDGQQHSPNPEGRRPFVYVQTQMSDMYLTRCKYRRTFKDVQTDPAELGKVIP